MSGLEPRKVLPPGRLTDWELRLEIGDPGCPADRKAACLRELEYRKAYRRDRAPAPALLPHA
jgi:hypothetical protein